MNQIMNKNYAFTLLALEGSSSFDEHVAYQFFILYEFAGRRSLQGSGMNIESDKHVQVTLPDNQVSCCNKDSLKN